MDSVELNLSRPPLDDHAVREALAWGLDRNLFVTSPPERAKRVLDAAGWTVGPDGVRAKNGMRLAFTLLDPDITQAELAPMSVSIQAQLKPLGFDVKLQQTQDYGGVIKSRDFDALIVSFNSVQTGDPLFQLARRLGKDGGLNWSYYSNPRLDALLTQLRGELDPVQRKALSHTAPARSRTSSPIRMTPPDRQQPLRYLVRLRRGSSRSRTASPKKLTASVMASSPKASSEITNTTGTTARRRPAK